MRIALSPVHLPGNTGRHLDFVLSVSLRPLAVAVVVLLVIASGARLYDFRHHQQVLPGVRFAGVSLAGLALTEAEAIMQARLAGYVDSPLILTGLGREWRPTAADLGMQIDSAAMAREALDAGRNGGFLTHLVGPLQLRWQPVTVPLRVHFDEDRLYAFLESVAADVDRAPLEAAVHLQDGQVVSVAPVSGHRLDIAAAKRLIAQLPSYPVRHRVELPIVAVAPTLGEQELQSALAVTRRILGKPLLLRYREQTWVIGREQLAAWLTFEQPQVNGQTFLRPTLSEAAVANYVAGIAAQLDDPPQDGRLLRLADGSVSILRPGKTGLLLDQKAATRAIIVAAMSTEAREVVLPVRVAEPRFTGKSTDALAFKDLLATGQSTFRGSAPERANNIQVAARHVNGVVIPPGGVFSFLAELGPITPEAGYLESLTIQGDATVPGIGGGICQVSTTVFRAAFWAGLPIVERNQHTYRVGYYEQDGSAPGLDAAVYDPGVDLKFRNDTEYPVLLQSSVDPTTMTLKYQLYGTRNERRVRIEDVVIRNRQEPGPPLPDVPDSSLPPGERKQVEWAAEGMHVTIRRAILEGDEVVRRDSFSSRFVPWREKWLVGAEPTPTPTVTATANNTPQSEAPASATPTTTTAPTPALGATTGPTPTP